MGDLASVGLLLLELIPLDIDPGDWTGDRDGDCDGDVWGCCCCCKVFTVAWTVGVPAA